MDMAALLLRKQVTERLSDAEMATRLGISRAMYRKVIRGKRRAGHRTLAGIAKAFPDVWEHVPASFAPRNVTIGPARDSRIAPEATGAACSASESESDTATPRTSAEAVLA